MKNRWRTILGFRVRVGSYLYKWLLANKARLHGWFKHHPKPPVPPKPVTSIFMFDDINVSLIPENAQAVAGYTDGKWATWNTVFKKFPHARKLSIAVFASDNADCLDVEPGDATPAEAPAWVKRQKLSWAVRQHDVRLPVLYTSASQGQALIDACSRAGLVYGKDYLWWSAHYNPVLGKHLCSGPLCGFGLKHEAHATQFTDHADNRSLDESVCSPRFFR